MSELLDEEQFDQLFHTFEHTAFRLETQDVYVEDYEQAEFRRFLAGEEISDSYPKMNSWTEMLRRSRAAGKRVERVRVVTVPHNDYARYLLHVSRQNVAAGEDIRYLARPEAEALGLPQDDYWLFDSVRAAYFHFAEDGRRSATELVDDSPAIVRCNRLRDVAWHHAVKWEEYAATHGVDVG